MATYYMVNASGNFQTAATWSTVATKSVLRTGATGVIPTVADTCIVDDWSSNGGGVVLTIDNAACTCKILTCTGYAGDIAFTVAKTLTVAGNVTFAATHTLSGTGTLLISGTSTMTSAGLTFPGALSFTFSFVATLAGNWIVTGLVSLISAQTINKTSTETLTCNGGLSLNAVLSGTATIILGGTGGTWSGGNPVTSNLTINCTTLTISGTVQYKTGTLTYTAGTVTTAGSTLSLTGTGTLNTAGITWNDIALTTAGTYTLGSALTCTGALKINNAASVFAGAYSISCGSLIGASNAAATLSLVAAQTLSVTGAITLRPLISAGVVGTFSIVSVTPSSSTYLNYSGSDANAKIAGVIFTDVDASGSAIPIDNWYGGTLTRTVNIANMTSANLARAADASKILTGQTVGLVAGSASGGGGSVTGSAVNRSNLIGGL